MSAREVPNPASVLPVTDEIRGIPPGFLIVFILLEVGIVVAGITDPWYAAGAVLASVLIYYTAANAFFGICSIVFLHFLVIRSTETIDPGEIAFGGYLFIVLVSWFIDKKLIRGDRLLTDTMDYSLAIFIGISLLSFVPALIFGNGLLKWFRELVPFLGYLLYYPMKDALKNSRQSRILSLCFMLLAIFVGMSNMIQYWLKIGEASYIWQLLAARQTHNEPFFLASFTVAAAFLWHGNSLRTRLTSLAVILFSGFALAISFSRGYWVAALFAMISLIFLADLRRTLRIAFYVPLLMLLSVVVLSPYVGDLWEVFVQVISDRAGSISELSKDPSLINRLNEGKTVLSLCLANPIIGYGLGAEYFFHNIIYGFTIRTWYSHNAYLFLLFKLGIFGLLSFCFFYVGAIRKSYMSFKESRGDSYQKSMSLGIVCTLISMIPLSITSPQFIQNDSILVIVLGASLATFMSNRGDQKEQ